MGFVAAAEIAKMPPNKSKQLRSQEMVNQADIDLLAQQLKDAADLNKSLAKSLQDEIVLNAQARIEFKKDIEHLCEVVGELKKVYSGNGTPPMAVRISTLEGEVKALKAALTQNKASEAKKSERFWNFVLQNSPVILTWIGLAIWAALQLAFGTTPPTP